MPRKKKTSKTEKETQISAPALLSETYRSNPIGIASKPIRTAIFTPKYIFLLVLLLLIVLVWKFKGYFIVAMVNGQPISRMQLNDQLAKRFGNQVLDSIINERLILAAARQKGIYITADEIDSKVKQIEKRLEGKLTLDDALKAQGVSKDDFRRQIEIQASIDKMFEKDATISSTEIDDYIKKNDQAYKNATDPAVVRDEVTSILRQQKISDVFETWFTDLRKNANIQRFL